MQPTSGHLVHFYENERHLMSPLTEFIRSGLGGADTCVVIATPQHIKALNASLEKHDVDHKALRQSGRYITLDAAETLSTFMVGGLPDRQRFFKEIGTVLGSAALSGKQGKRHIRAYGEMVALLWQDGNKQAVMELEQLWNELADHHDFSLFCAYPELHFCMNYEVVEEIRDYHNVELPLRHATGVY